jgi:hypothetical protein
MADDFSARYRDLISGRSAPQGRTPGACAAGAAARSAAALSTPGMGDRFGGERFTSTEVVYGVADPDVTALPEYGVSP